MRYLPIVLTAVLAAGLAACSRPESHDRHAGEDSTASAAEPSGDYYTCPMHPSVVSDRPGACPICGMSLVRRSPAAPRQGNQPPASVRLSPEQRVTANVATEAVQRRTYTHTVTAAGVIDYAEPSKTSVSARFRGRIERLHVDFTGAVVRKGDPLFEVYSPDLASAQRDYVLALEAEADRPDNDAAASPPGTGELVDAARERLRVHFGMTEAQLEHIRTTRRSGSTVTFYAPIGGTVTTKDVREGEYVGEGTLLYELADLSSVWAYFDVYEQDIRFIRPGLDVVVRAEAYPGETLRGKVTFIDPVLDSRTRTTRVRVEFRNSGGHLKPQMYVRGDMRIPMAPALVVPRTSILSTGTRNVVWVEVETNLFEPRDVRIGLTGEDGVQVLSGLHEGDRVAVRGGFLIDSESQLQRPTADGGHRHD